MAANDDAGVPARTGKSKTVQSVDRAVALLRALAGAQSAMSLKALATVCGLETATAWRLIWTLQSHGLIEKADATGGYRLGVGVLELVGAQGMGSLVSVGRPLLERLASEHGITASLAYVERHIITYIDQVDSARFRSPDWRGQTVSLYASSPGKAVLAWMPEEECRSLLGDSLVALTDTTITDFDVLMTELAGVRKVGYAECRGEDESYSNGVSATVRLGGRVIAVIDLWGPERLVPEARFTTLGAAARKAAQEMEQLLQHGPSA